ncbi:MAG: bestrophin family ion channel [Chitinophagales bacterium]
MYTKRHYGFWMTFNWSKKPFFYALIYAFTINLLHVFLHDHIELSLPWQPISIIGIAVAFYLGFKNNSSYDRTWEARKIWGSIVNNSRSFGAAIVAFVQGEQADTVKKELIYRHIAWMTALRYQLRLSKEWEHTEERVNGLYTPNISEEYYEKLDDEVMNFISEAEFEGYKSKANIATQILATQSKRLQELRDLNYFEDFRHIAFHDLIVSFYEDQGKSERIKNFPFPRQYASTALWVTIVFSILFPLGMLGIFEDKAPLLFWLSPVFSALAIWVFFLMEMIGDYSENPFEGSYNDVPITAIARGIEIDMRQMINDENIPEGVKAENGFLL